MAFSIGPPYVSLAKTRRSFLRGVRAVGVSVLFQLIVGLFPGAMHDCQRLLPAALLLLSFIHHAVGAIPDILVYSKTAGYRHESIPVAIDALKTIGSTTSLFNATFSEDENLFTPSQLSAFEAIIFLSNSAQVLTLDGEDAFKKWLTGGGGLVGLHAATACLFEDEAFGVAMGSWFDYHPTIQNATFTKLVSHPTIDPLPERYNIYEEVYNFRSDPRSVNATVLLTVDPTSYVDPAIGTRPYYQGSPHPIAWFRDSPVDLGNGTNNGAMTGRMWMTSLGHTNDTWEDPIYLAHVEAGIRWVLESATTTNVSSTANPLSSSTRMPTMPISSSSKMPMTTASKTPASAGSTGVASSLKIEFSLFVPLFAIIFYTCLSS